LDAQRRHDRSNEWDHTEDNEGRQDTGDDGQRKSNSKSCQALFVHTSSLVAYLTNDEGKVIGNRDAVDRGLSKHVKNWWKQAIQSAEGVNDIANSGSYSKCRRVCTQGVRGGFVHPQRCFE
jgi:hypothetical protein